MGYTAMQGGLSAIKAAEDLVRRRTLGRRRHALDPSEVAEKMSLGVDRVMSEGGLYDPAAAAVALRPAERPIVFTARWKLAIAAPYLSHAGAWRGR